MKTPDGSEDGRTLTNNSACDNCKTRKTECDRQHPCSSCTTAKLECKTSRKPPERCQRVLLSTKYDDHMASIDHRLDELHDGLKRLLAKSECSSPVTTASSRFPGLVSEVPSSLKPLNGFQGESSFQAHASQVAATISTSSAAEQLLQEVDESQPVTNVPDEDSISAYGLDMLPLPPAELVIKVLRLIATNGHRFFDDDPIIDQEHFVQCCQRAYFAVEPCSIWSWIIVDVGLFFLLYRLDGSVLRQIGIDATGLDSLLSTLRANAEVVCLRLKLCITPSVAACRALALLTTFCIRTGLSSLAWTLVATTARMCLDLGLHRLPKREDVRPEQVLFWYVCVYDQGLAFTYGRSPTIHHYDVTSERPFPGAHGFVYNAYMDLAVFTGEMQLSLFSASAQREQYATRVERALSFATRLRQMQDSLMGEYGDMEEHSLSKDAAKIMNVEVYCLLTVVYRIVPPEKFSHPLQCCNECVVAARCALSALLEVEAGMVEPKLMRWSMFLNLTFSLVPFAAFVVLVGNTIATHSMADLELLESVVRVIEPTAEITPGTRKLNEICQKFFRIAQEIVTLVGSQGEHIGTDIVQEEVETASGPPTTPGFDIPMAVQDWAGSLQSFDINFEDIDAAAMAGVVEPYLWHDMAWPRLDSC